MKFLRVQWGRFLLFMGQCPYCYSDPKYAPRCPVCNNQKPGDKEVYRDYNWKQRLWRRFKAHIDADYS